MTKPISKNQSILQKSFSNEPQHPAHPQSICHQGVWAQIDWPTLTCAPPRTTTPASHRNTKQAIIRLSFTLSLPNPTQTNRPTIQRKPKQAKQDVHAWKAWHVQQPFQWKQPAKFEMCIVHCIPRPANHMIPNQTKLDRLATSLPRLL